MNFFDPCLVSSGFNIMLTKDFCGNNVTRRLENIRFTDSQLNL